MNMEFRDMQEQDTFHAGREYERKIQAKEGDILNPCGHRNSERVKALMEFPSSMCPACLFERIENLKSLLEQLIFIAEKSTTDDAEDTTIELANNALKG